MKIVIAVVLMVATILPLQACAAKYSAESVIAWVVDAETKQPIEMVNIVAHWQLEGGLEGGNNIGQIMVMEAVTDSSGKFTFPAWGPKETPSGLSIFHRNARLKNMDPELLFFKAGYEFLQLVNHKSISQISSDEPYVRTSEWNGKVIEMKRFNGDLKAYAGRVSGLNYALINSTATVYYATQSHDPKVPSRDPRGGCEWRQIPRMIVAISKQGEIFRAANIYDSDFYSHLMSNEDNFLRNACGSVKEFLREREK